MYKKARPLFGLLVLAMTQASFAAPVLGPPIENLKSNPERVRIAAAVASEKQESPRIKFAVSKRLSGESPDELILRLDEKIYQDVEVGRAYILAWTDLRKVRLLRKGYEKDPDGPSVVRVQGLDISALFEDSPEIRYLFSTRDSVSAESAAREIDALLAQISRDDIRSRDLAVAQLYLKQGLSEHVSPLQVEKIRQVLQSPGLGAQHRDYLLQSVLRLPEELRMPWLAEEYRKVIILEGTQYDLNSFVPGLVKSAAAGLGQVGDQDDIDLLSNLLYANNPGVARAALASMDRLDRSKTVQRAEQAMTRGWVHVQVRRLLEEYLERGPAGSG